MFSFVEFCFWNAYDDMTNFQRNYSLGEVEVIGSAIYHKTEYRERRNHYAVFSVNTPIDGFDTDRESFSVYITVLTNLMRCFPVSPVTPLPAVGRPSVPIALK